MASLVCGAVFPVPCRSQHQVATVPAVIAGRGGLWDFLGMACAPAFHYYRCPVMEQSRPQSLSVSSQLFPPRVAQACVAFLLDTLPGPQAWLSLLLVYLWPPAHTVHAGALAQPPKCGKGWTLGGAAPCSQDTQSPSLSPFRSAAYSTPRDSASLVSRRTSVLFLRKFGKTWRKGKLHQRGPPASPVLGRECSQGWVIGQHPAQSSWASLRQGCCRAGSCHAWPCFWTTGSSTAAQGSWSPVWSSHRPREL